MPHRSISADVQSLSTVRSIVLAEFITANAALLQTVERIDPENDLLQRAGWNDAGEYGSGPVQLFGAGPKRGPAADRRDQPFVGHDRPGVPARGERAGQLTGVPSLSGGENDKVQTTAARR